MGHGAQWKGRGGLRSERSEFWLMCGLDAGDGFGAGSAGFGGGTDTHVCGSGGQ